jgi:Tol biopolymer transport system component/predicted Ser/Thr protein kinase
MLLNVLMRKAPEKQDKLFYRCCGGRVKLHTNMSELPEPESGGGEWEIVKDLLFQWETDQPANLDAWLTQNCPTPAIRQEVERLARAALTSGDFLEGVAAQQHLGVSAQHPVHIGRYRVIEELGAGGSGVVYAAYDPKLERRIAIKVLTGQAAAAARQRRRLRRDAKAASAAAHPNIVTIHDIASEGDFDYIVMECVEGHPLGKLITAGGMPEQTLLSYVIQISAALVAAHRSGVVHRDLKPNNIMVTDEGVVKVLDFGLAKQENPSEDGASLTTIEGHFAGTVAYVSPEQAEGRPVDNRGDIFSFGCILYEMLTGQQAFQGRTAPSVVGSILHQPAPALRRVAPQVDERFDAIVQRCLQKQPADRYPNMDEVKAALEELVEDRPTPQRLSFRSRRLLIQGALAASLAAFAIVGALWVRASKVPAPEAQFTQVRFTTDNGLTSFPAVAPQGNLVAYASDRGGKGDLNLWVQQWNLTDAQQITSNAADEYAPSFNPQGTQLIYRSEQDGGGLYQISTLGRTQAPVLVVPKGRDGHFSPDGEWLAYWKGEFGSGLLTGSAQTYVLWCHNGQPTGQPDVFPAGFDVAAYPIWSPSENTILFFGRKTGEKDGDWFVANFTTKAIHRTGIMAKLYRLKAHYSRATTYPVPGTWMKDGTVLFTSTNVDATNLWAVRIDHDGQVVSEPRHWSSGTESEQYPSAATTPSGLVHAVYAALNTTSSIWKVPLKTGGRESGTPQLLAQMYRSGSPSVSNDGTQMVFSTRAPHGDIIQFASLGGSLPVASTTLRLGQNSKPTLSGDGQVVAWWNNPNAYAMKVHGDTPHVVCPNCGQPSHLNFDGSKVIFEDGRPDGLEQLQLVVAGQNPRPLFHFRGPHPWLQTAGRLSPDEKWVAFSGWHSGDHKREILVAPFTADGTVDDGQVIEVANDEHANREPIWSADGRRLYFLSDSDGALCVWARDVDAVTKRPAGDSFPVAHFHNAARLVRGPTSDSGSIGLSIARDFLVLTLTDTQGNIWSREIH